MYKLITPLHLHLKNLKITKFYSNFIFRITKIHTFIKLSALVIKTMSDLVTDDPANSSVVHVSRPVAREKHSLKVTQWKKSAGKKHALSETCFHKTCSFKHGSLRNKRSWTKDFRTSLAEGEFSPLGFLGRGGGYSPLHLPSGLKNPQISPLRSAPGAIHVVSIEC